MSKTNNIGTYTFTSTGGPANNGVYTIIEGMGISSIALKLLTGGAGTIQGSATIPALGGASTSFALVVDEPTVVATNNENEFIDGLVITVTSGNLLVITNQ